MKKTVYWLQRSCSEKYSISPCPCCPSAMSGPCIMIQDLNSLLNGRLDPPTLMEPGDTFSDWEFRHFESLTLRWLFQRFEFYRACEFGSPWRSFLGGFLATAPGIYRADTISRTQLQVKLIAGQSRPIHHRSSQPSLESFLWIRCPRIYDFQPLNIRFSSPFWTSFCACSSLGSDNGPVVLLRPIYCDEEALCAPATRRNFDHVWVDSSGTGLYAPRLRQQLPPPNPPVVPVPGHGVYLPEQGLLAGTKNIRRVTGLETASLVVTLQFRTCSNVSSPAVMRKTTPLGWHRSFKGASTRQPWQQSRASGRKPRLSKAPDLRSMPQPGRTPLPRTRPGSVPEATTSSSISI